MRERPRGPQGARPWGGRPGGAGEPVRGRARAAVLGWGLGDGPADACAWSDPTHVHPEDRLYCILKTF